MTGAITATGDFTVDVGADISLDCGGGILKFKEAGTEIARLQASSSDFVIKSMVEDKAIIFKGNDGGSTIEAFRIEIQYGGRINGGTRSTGTTYWDLDKTTGAAQFGGATSSNNTRIDFRNPNGWVGAINTNGSATSYNTSSDYRLKENVDYTWDATTRLKQLKPARFNFIADADTTMEGFLAHEVSSIVPEAISGEKDAMMDEEYEVTPAVMDGETVVTPAVMGTHSVIKPQNIDQSKLVPLLVKTIQELEARITAGGL